MKRSLLALVALISAAVVFDASAEGRRRGRGCRTGKCHTKEVVASCDPEPCCVKTVQVKKPAIRQCHYTWVCPEGFEEVGTEASK
jgi:hypothetical protein